MKKVIALLLVISMVFVLCACGRSGVKKLMCGYDWNQGEAKANKNTLKLREKGADVLGIEVHEADLKRDESGKLCQICFSSLIKFDGLRDGIYSEHIDEELLTELDEEYAQIRNKAIKLLGKPDSGGDGVSDCIWYIGDDTIELNRHFNHHSIFGWDSYWVDLFIIHG